MLLRDVMNAEMADILADATLMQAAESLDIGAMPVRGAENELRIRRGTNCRCCTRSCQARDAIKAGTQCGTTRCGAGEGPVRT